MNNISLFKNIAMEAMGIEPEVPAYPGSELPECHLALDTLDDMQIAVESHSDAIFGMLTVNQEIALESAGLGLDQIDQFTGELGTESIVNRAQSLYYGAKIQIKKILAKVVAMIKAILEFFGVADGRLASYGKLFKKYGEKLVKVEGNAYKKDKEISVRNFGNLSTELDSFKSAAALSGLKATLTDLKKVGNDAGAVSTALKVTFGSLLEGINVTTVAEIETCLDEKLLDKKIDDKKENFKWSSETLTLDNAIATFKSYCDTFKESAKEDVKYKKDMKALQKELDKAIEKLDVEKMDINDDTKKEMAIETIKLLNAKAKLFVNVKKNLSKYYKMVAGGLQACLADAAKVISAATVINEK